MQLSLALQFDLYCTFLSALIKATQEKRGFERERKRESGRDLRQSEGIEGEKKERRGGVPTGVFVRVASNCEGRKTTKDKSPLRRSHVQQQQEVRYSLILFLTLFLVCTTRLSVLHVLHCSSEFPVELLV